jgi:ribosomal protein S27AE
MPAPLITYLRADCPNCGRRWAILADPEHGQDYYCDAALPLGPEFTVAGPDAACPKCNMPLVAHAAIVTAGGTWLAVADGPTAALN